MRQAGAKYFSIYGSLLFIDIISIIKEALRRSGNEFYRGSDTCAIANYNEQINLLFPSLAEYPTYFSHGTHNPALEFDNKEKSSKCKALIFIAMDKDHGSNWNFI